MKIKVLEPPHNNPKPTEAYTGLDAYQQVDTCLECGNCGNWSFLIYQDSYLTVAKCNECQYEYCVHEG